MVSLRSTETQQKLFTIGVMARHKTINQNERLY